MVRGISDMICPRCRYDLDDENHDRYCELVQEIVRLKNKTIKREISQR